MTRAAPAAASVAASVAALPSRPNLTFLRKLAKARLKSLRAAEPDAKLADAQLAVAREHGFASWRKLKAYVDSTRRTDRVAELFAAIERDDVGGVRKLLTARRALASARDADGRTPLHVAAERNNPDLVAVLLAHGGDATAHYGHSAHTPLSWALTVHAFEAAEALVRGGVKPDLFCAAGLGALDAVRSFFDDAGNVRPGASQTGSSRLAPDGSPLPRPPQSPREVVSDALYIACRNARTEVARFLLERGGPDLSFRAYMGGTPLHWACFGGSRQIVQMLLEAGADPAARDDVFRATPRAFGIVVPANWGMLRMVARQLQADLSLVNVADARGTPLHEAARGGHREIVELLLKVGADRAARDADGKNPRDLAVAAGHSAVVELFDGTLAPPRSAATTTEFDPDALARAAVRAMERGWAESGAIIEREFDEPGEQPRWESAGLESHTLREREADDAITRRAQPGLYRMASVWHHISISAPRTIIADASSQPTRSLELLRGGDDVNVPLAGGRWRPIEWKPSVSRGRGKPGRWQDLAEALKFLRDRAEPGRYRIISVRRMLRARSTTSGLKVIKKHAFGEHGLPVNQSTTNNPTPTRAPEKKIRKSDWQPVMDAAFAGDDVRARQLLDAGADPNVLSTTNYRHRPLHRAIEHKKTSPKHAGHERVVKLLLEHGAHPKLRATASQLTALQLAAMDETRFVPLLRRHFEPLDIFHAAVLAEDRRVAQLLAGDRELATARDANGATALQYCAGSAMYRLSDELASKLVRIAGMLLDAGADPNATYLFADQWPIPVLFGSAGHHDNPAVTELLLRHGADPCDGESVYHASDEGHDACLALFEKYVDPKKLAAECTRCLSTQLHWGRTRGAAWLLAHGADPNRVSSRWGNSALHAAVEAGSNDRIIRLLLANGGDPKRKNKQGKTAIDLARASKAAKRLLPVLESGTKTKGARRR
jgi:ankyrin repeat protein